MRMQLINTPLVNHSPQLTVFHTPPVQRIFEVVCTQLSMHITVNNIFNTARKENILLIRKRLKCVIENF